jgi:two-component system, cell cycle sensor histidine kinase and response regulator CckA
MEPFSQSDAHFRRLIEDAQDLIYRCDEKGRFSYVNPTAVRLMKYEAAELIGRRYLTLIRDDYQARAKEWYLRQFREGTANSYFEFPAVTKDGETLWVGQHVQLLYDGDQLAGFQAIARDISERKAAEDRLQRSEARYRSLFERAKYGMYRSTADGRLLDVNPALATMLGYDSTSEVMAQNAVELYRDPSVRAELLEEIRRSGMLSDKELIWIRKDGKSLTVRLSARPVQNDEGAPAEFEVTVEDVTERRRIEEQLRLAQKMEAVGQLAAGIAHNFNNLLTTILGYTELLSLRIPSAADREDLEEIQRAGRRAATLTHQLLAFSRKQIPTPREVDLNETIAAFKDMLARLIRDDMNLLVTLTEQPATIRIDPVELEQVIVNLVANARDALPPGGRIEIEVMRARLEEPRVEFNQSIPAGEYAALRVADNGTGLTPDVRAHLFEPFFTTKEPGKGTGLGLASVYGIVRQCNGFISVSSEIGAGTTFTIYFPAIRTHTAAAVVKRAPRAAPSLEDHCETVLVVEDEDAVRMIMSTALRQQGYHVLEAATPNLACHVFDEHSLEIDLLLTDVVMPEMSGPTLAQRFVQSRPNLPVLFVSGYTDEGLPLGAGFPRVSFLSKPFQASMLTKTVREILDGARQVT